MRTNAVRLEESVSPVEVLRELVEWEALLGGWQAPCWERARAVLRSAERQVQSQAHPETKARDAAQMLIKKLCGVLFWELRPEGWVMNPDKLLGAGTLEEVIRIVRPLCHGCDGAGVLASGETCDECEGEGLAPADWKERNDYT